ncbi:MAG: DUF1648 domain-containing protein [Prevotella sp.]|jgi:uncharacterized membrane protein|nr:DUF1648 domain-containing protein [Prevotella sp.]
MKLSNYFIIKKYGPHPRMPRTPEGSIFEVVALFLIIALWAVAVYMFHHAPESIPTHFDLQGNPNSYGSRTTLLFLAGGGTLAAVVMLVCAYYPTTFLHVPASKVTLPQCILISRMVRVAALLLCFLFFAIILMVCYPTVWPPKAIFWTVIALLVCMVVALGIFEAKIKKIG